MKSPDIYVGFMGACGAGKSTIAKAWAEKFYKDAYRMVIYASPLKDAAFAAGWSGQKDAEGRKWLQEFADNYKREHGKTVFLDRAMQSAVADSDTCKVCIFEDVRLLQEIRALHLLNEERAPKVALIYIENDEAVDRWNKAYNEHVTGQSNFGWTVHETELEWRTYVATSHNPQLIVKNDLKTDLD